MWGYVRFRGNRTKMRKIDPEIEFLIYRFLRGELSRDEREILDCWLQKEEHRMWFERICNKENILQKTTYFDQLDKGRGKSWQWLEERSGLGRRRRIRRWMAVAASLMIPLFIGIWGYNMLWDKTSLQQEQYVKITPEKSSVRLYLPDGKVVNLGQDSVYSLKLADGGTLLNERGTLTYRGDSTIKNVTSYNELRIPRGGEYKLILPDGTIVWLNAESSLRFPNEFSDKVRKVYASGELYFKVARDEKRPFEVEIGKDYSVKVLGTEFNTRAYGDAARTTTLVKGSVQVKGNGQEVVLKPGQQAVEMSEGKRFEVKEVDVESCVAWRNGMFNFKHVPLQEIMQELSRWYNVQVVFENEKMKKECFSLEMKRFDDFNRVIDLIKHTRMVNITVKDSVVIIR